MRHPRPKLLQAAAAAAAVAVALSGCASAPQDSGDDGKKTYEAGGVKLDAKPEKIVSLSATGTEMLYAIDAGDQVEAVDSTSNYPKDVPKTDLDAFNPNVESIAGYEPDLVVVSHDQKDIRDKLKEVKVPTYFAPAATTLDDTYQQIEDLGKLTGHADKAKKLTGDIESDIDTMLGKLPESDKKPTAYFELDNKFFSLTSDTYAGALVEMAGMKNIADDADDAAETGGYPQLSGEYILNADPDFIFVSGKGSAKALKDREGWNSLTAVKNGNVVELNPDHASRWGPRVVELMEDITGAVAKAKQ